MAEHDQRFKTLIREFFAELIALFFSKWVAALDFARLDWLDKELMPDPPAGQGFYADLVARVGSCEAIPALRPEEKASDSVLVHLEVEAEDRVTGVRGRAYDYHKHLRDRYHVPVLTGALYLRVGLAGLGIDVYEETVLGEEQTRFSFRYAGFPALDAEKYVRGDNLLGVALTALMKVAPDRRGWLAAEALRRIVESQERPWRKHLLAECVQAYLQLDDEQRGVFEGLLRTEPFQGVKAMAQTWYEQGEEKGIEKGELRGRRLLLQELIEAKFGPLAPQLLQQVEGWSPEQLKQAGFALLDAQSLEDLGLRVEPSK
jgi:hypothetical protein